MGILDDAIREHLDLKRSHGATDSELRRLEDEAFGPPSRPGEPDFPESEEMPAQAGNGSAAETAVVDAPAPEAEVAPAPEVEEQPAAEHPVVEATPEPESDAPPEASEPEVDDQTAVYDRPSDEELPLEDLEPTADEPPAEPPAEEPPSEEAPALQEPHAPGAPDVPIESLETVEHPFPDEVVEPETSPADEPESSHDEQGDEAPPAIDEPEAPPSEEGPALEGEPEEGDDVLADTPEFLKDAPEDDELWFEQGEPKDFDF
jgi:hypothetical protein